MPPALVSCRAVTPSPSPDSPLSAPARALALTLSDLPGFTLREELAPTLTATGSDDPFGRLGSYSATFAQSGSADAPLVTSSINTYAGITHARTAFGSWRSLVPRQYRPIMLALGLDEQDAAAYSRDGDGTILVGYRVRNVLGSLRAPAADAERLVRLMLERCAKA